MSDLYDKLPKSVLKENEANRHDDMVRLTEEYELPFEQIIELRFPRGGAGEFATMHLASVIMDTVHRNLCECPSVVNDPRRYALAVNAGQALFDLYQIMAEENLTARDMDDETIS